MYLLGERMTNLTRSKFQTSHFHLVSPSPWPLYTNVALFTLTTSGIITMHCFSNAIFIFWPAFMTVILSMSFWWRDVIRQVFFWWRGIIIEVFFVILFFIKTYPYITFRICFFVFYCIFVNDVVLDNTLLSSSNLPTGGGGNLPPVGGGGGGGNPLPPAGGANAPMVATTARPLLLNDDVDPLHAQRLRTVYFKLSRLLAVNDNYDLNRGLTMNSPRLTQDLVFTNVDRNTMFEQITQFHPNMFYRFNMVRNRGFSYSNPMTTEILNLFKPDTQL
jgi:hypothetical protein